MGADPPPSISLHSVNRHHIPVINIELPVHTCKIHRVSVHTCTHGYLYIPVIDIGLPVHTCDITYKSLYTTIFTYCIDVLTCSIFDRPILQQTILMHDIIPSVVHVIYRPIAVHRYMLHGPPIIHVYIQV